MICVVLPISRRDYLKPVFDSLTALEKPIDTQLIILIDGDEALRSAVEYRAYSMDYANTQLIKFGDGAPADRNERRYRIAEIHNKIKHCLPEECDYVFAIEDDTVVPPHALANLLELFDEPNVAYASGVELGRWNTPYVGAWIVDDVYNPSKIISLAHEISVLDWGTDASYLESKAETETIDAGGLYCALIDADIYKMHQFEPFDKQGKNGLGCDVNFGLYLRQQSYKCLIDWSVQCDHIGDKGSVNLGNTKPVRVQFTKDVTGKWFGKAI